jgi:UDP-glucose 4-epimerase
VQPHCPYGATKSFFETYLASLTRARKDAALWSAKPSDLNFFSWISLRLGNVYGPRQTTKGEAGVVPIFFEALQSGQVPKIFGDGSKTREYVHVSDVTRAFISAYDRLSDASFDEGFNISSGTETADREVFETVLGEFKKLGQTDRYSQVLKLGMTVTQPLWSAVRPGELKRCSLNIHKADGFLSWTPEILFEEGVRGTLETYAEKLVVSSKG